MIGIIGSSGFIGQNLTVRLKNTTGISLRDSNWKEQIVNKDVFLNLVGKAHDHSGRATEKDFYYANVELTKEILSVFVASSASLLVHVSSLAALEELEANEGLVETDKCKPISLYGRSKLAAEELLLAQELPAGKKLIILRPPMVHGPGDKGNLRLLFKLMCKGIPYPLASFENRRSFISIDNFCFFVQQIIENQEKLESGIYHVADDESISTNQIIDIIKKVTKKNVPSLSLPQFLVKAVAKLGDVLPIPLDTIRLKKMTSNLLVSNVKIKIGLGIDKLPLTAEEGIEKTIRSFTEA